MKLFLFTEKNGITCLIYEVDDRFYDIYSSANIDALVYTWDRATIVTRLVRL